MNVQIKKLIQIFISLDTLRSVAGWVRGQRLVHHTSDTITHAQTTHAPLLAHRMYARCARCAMDAMCARCAMYAMTSS